MKADLARFIVRDPELGPALHKLRSAGKKLFLLTNSHLDYTEAVMRHVLDGVLPEYPSWRNYFDAVITASGKPGFFSSGSAPFLELDAAGAPLSGEVRALERGRIYAGGNRSDLERLLGAGGDRVLYVGDHIYGDILRSKKSSQWRTCLVIEELEREIDWLDRNRAALEEVAGLEELRLRVDDEAAAHRAALNALERRLDRLAAGDPSARTPSRPSGTRMKRELEALRAALRDANARSPSCSPGRERLQPLLGAHLQGGERELPHRRADRGLRLRLHEPGLELRLLLPHAVLPRAAPGHAARGLGASPRTVGRLAALTGPSGRLHRSAAGRPRLVPGPVFKTGEWS